MHQNNKLFPPFWLNSHLTSFHFKEFSTNLAIQLFLVIQAHISDQQSLQTLVDSQSSYVVYQYGTASGIAHLKARQAPKGKQRKWFYNCFIYEHKYMKQQTAVENKSQE